MTLELEVSTEVSDRIAEIGRSVVVPKPATYDSPEGLLFRKALALIEDGTNWVPKAAMGDDHSMCSLGALFVAGGRYKYSPPYIPQLKALCIAIRGDDHDFNVLPDYNDSHTHAEVIAKWHEAGHANGWLPVTTLTVDKELERIMGVKLKPQKYDSEIIVDAIESFCDLLNMDEAKTRQCVRYGLEPYWKDARSVAFCVGIGTQKAFALKRQP